MLDGHVAVRVAAARVGEAGQYELELLAAERVHGVAEVDGGAVVAAETDGRCDVQVSAFSAGQRAGGRRQSLEVDPVAAVFIRDDSWVADGCKSAVEASDEQLDCGFGRVHPCGPSAKVGVEFLGFSTTGHASAPAGAAVSCAQVSGSPADGVTDRVDLVQALWSCSTRRRLVRPG